LIGVGKIGRQGNNGGCSIPGDVVDLGRRLIQIVSRQIDQADGHARFGQAFAHRFADPAGGTGDHGDMAG